MKIWTGATIPNGFFLCDGRAISRQNYKALFSVIGTTYGSGDGNTTFNIPDMRDRFMQGANTTNFGNSINAGLPNIAGTFAANTGGPYGSAPNPTLAFTKVSGFNLGMASGVDNRPYSNFSFNASKGETKLDGTLKNDVYGKSDTVQPPSVAINYIIKY